MLIQWSLSSWRKKQSLLHKEEGSKEKPVGDSRGPELHDKRVLYYTQPLQSSDSLPSTYGPHTLVQS